MWLGTGNIARVHNVCLADFGATLVLFRPEFCRFLTCRNPKGTRKTANDLKICYALSILSKYRPSMYRQGWHAIHLYNSRSTALHEYALQNIIHLIRNLQFHKRYIASQSNPLPPADLSSSHQRDETPVAN